MNGGDALFSPDHPVDSAAKRGAEIIARANQRMGVDAWLPGPLDLAAGHDSFRALARAYGLPVVATNLVRSDGSSAFADHAVRQFGAARVIIIGLVGQERWPAGAGLVVRPPVAAARAVIERVSRPGDLVVIVTRCGLDAAVTLARELPRAAAVLTADPKSYAFLPREVRRSEDAIGGRDVPVATVGHTGQHLALFSVHLVPGDPQLHSGALHEDAWRARQRADEVLARDPEDKEARRRRVLAATRLAPLIGRTHYFYSFVDLTPELPEDPQVAAWRAGLEPRGER